MMRPGRPLGFLVGLVLLAALGGALASPPAARPQAADVLLNVLATGAKKLNIVIPHFTVVGGPDTQGLGRSLSQVTARDLTFSSLFSVVSDVPAIPVGDPAALRAAFANFAAAGAHAGLQGVLRQRAHDPLHGDGLPRQRPPRALARGVHDVPSLGDQPVEPAPEAQLGLDRIVGEIVQGEERRVPALLALPGDRAVGPLAPQHDRSVAPLGEENPQGSRARRASARHAAAPLEPPAHAAVPDVHRLDEHQRASAHDALEAAFPAQPHRGLRHAAPAKRTMEPEASDAAVRGLPHDLRRHVGMGRDHDPVHRLGQGGEVGIGRHALELRGVRIQRVYGVTAGNELLENGVRGLVGLAGNAGNGETLAAEELRDGVGRVWHESSVLVLGT